MKPSKIFSILICLAFYSCGSDTNHIKHHDTPKAKSNDTIEVQRRTIHDIDKSGHEEKIAEQQKIDPELLIIWNKFTKIIAGKNYNELKDISLDSIEACHVFYKSDKFIQKCLPTIFDTTLLKRIFEISYSTYLDNKVISSYMPQFLLTQISSVGSSFKLNQFQVLKELTPDGGWTMTFDFVKTRNGYKFYSCDSFGGPDCCR